MSRYTLVINRSAEKEMDALPPVSFERVSEAILKFENEPRPRGCKKLRGTEDYRLRVGVYRVLYRVDDDRRVITIVSMGHRRDIYRH